MREYDRHFSPKRFNRFPRFSQVVKGPHGQEEHLKDKMVSLSPEILGYITNQNNAIARGQMIEPAAEADLNGLASYDPFENVVLISNIDNQILTSFRTFRGDNNFFSDTQKVIHKKFMPQKPYPGLNHKVPNQRQYNVKYLLEGEAFTP